MSNTTSTSTAAKSRGLALGMRTWVRALRVESFPVSIVPALLGVAIAWQRGFEIDMWIALLTLAGAVAIHAATNLLQDFFDFKSGIDGKDALGGSGVLTGGLASARSVLVASFVFYFVSAALAGYLIYASGFALVWIVGAGCVAGSLYAVPKYGLKYNQLGDIGVFAAFGIGITVGSYYIQTGELSWYPVFYAVPFGLLVVALLHANNMRDAKSDLAAGLENPACRAGENFSRAFYAVIVAAAYLIPTIAVFAGLITRGALAVLVTFPLGLKLMRAALAAKLGDGRTLGPLVTRTALLALAFGIAMILGIVLYGVING